MKKNVNIFGILSILIAFVIAIISFTTVRFNLFSIINGATSQIIDEKFQTQNLEKVEVVAKTNDVIFAISSDDEIHVNYIMSKQVFCEMKNENNALKLNCKNSLDWYHYVIGYFPMKVTILIPANCNVQIFLNGKTVDMHSFL